MLGLVCLLIGVAGFAVHALAFGRGWDRAERLENAARWWFAAVGVWLFISGLGHVMIPDEIAESIGWPTGSPFQREVGFGDLAWGVVALLCVRVRGTMREAVAIGTGIFLWGAAGGHIYEMLAHDNSAPNNSGVMLYVDIVVPVVSIALLWWLRMAERPQRGGVTVNTQPAAAD